MKISEQLKKVLEQAFNFARKSNHEFLTPEHILYASLNNDYVLNLLLLCETDVIYVRQSLDTYLKEKIPQTANKAPIETMGYQSVMGRAIMHCASADKQVLDLVDVIVSMLDEQKNHCSFYLKKAGLTRLQLLEAIGYAKSVENEDSIIEDSSQDISSESDYTSNEQARPKKIIITHTSDQGEKQAQKKSLLQQYTRDLIAEAKAGRLEKLIGREEELLRTMQVLCRRSKNNPIHVGEPGVGKTAITEGLAQKIALGEVPDLLKDYSLYSLDMGAIIAGAKFRGDFEERIKKLTDELLKKEKCILFIDEIHSIIGAGSTSAGNLDASSLLKPMLTAGKIRCIGSTTYDEYSKIFEKDRALARRFQKIDIAEPSVQETLSMLKGLAPHYEKHHGVTYTEEAIQAAVDLSSLYITDRFLPDKAIDVIDEAGSWMRLHGKSTVDTQEDNIKEKKKPSKNEVDVSLIEMTVARIAKIPEKTVNTDEREKLRTLHYDLSNLVFGQEKALEAVSTAVKRSRAGFSNTEKPSGCFLFVGPTGVGKTELAKSLSECLGTKLLRFDMSEYQEKHTVSRLIGSPPGYVGFEEGGLLTGAVRKDPHAIILLDEIEKAHSDIYNILLQVMDYGSLTDNQGRKADFRNSMIIMTSNAGARNINSSLIGFGERKESEQAVFDAVEKAFSPEFRNRLDAVIAFGHLNKEIMSDIANKEVNKLNARLENQNVFIDVSNEAILFLTEKGYSEEFGARNMSRTIDEYIASPLVDEVLFGKLSKGGKVKVTVKGDKIVLACTQAKKSKVKEKAELA